MSNGGDGPAEGLRKPTSPVFWAVVGSLLGLAATLCGIASAMQVVLAVFGGLPISGRAAAPNSLGFAAGYVAVMATLVGPPVLTGWAAAARPASWIPIVVGLSFGGLVAGGAYLAGCGGPWIATLVALNVGWAFSGFAGGSVSAVRRAKGW